MTYRVTHVTRWYLPDDRLVRVTADPGVLTFGHRQGFIAPRLVYDLDRMSRRIIDSGLFIYEPTRLGMPSPVVAWLERVPADMMPAGETISGRIGYWTDSRLPPFFEIRVRDDLIKPELVREFNEEAIPYAVGSLVPIIR